MEQPAPAGLVLRSRQRRWHNSVRSVHQPQTGSGARETVEKSIQYQETPCLSDSPAKGQQLA